MDAHIPSPSAAPRVPGAVGEPFRRSANYRPSVWGDRFLTHASDSLGIDDVETTKKFQQLKEEVRGLISAVVVTPHDHYKMLTLINDIQRLGVSYHFEDEIDRVLEHVYRTHYEDDPKTDPSNRDLHTVSLRFRLLRQHGYNVSCDVFRKFMNKDSVLKEPKVENVQALLSFYEATQFQIHGEDMLADGYALAVSGLKNLIPHLSPQTAAQARRALKWPIHKGLQRLDVRYYIDDVYGPDHYLYHEPLLMFAKLDFNFLQKVHRQELTFITRWWKELDFTQKLPFARDRVVECYFWSLGVFFKPEDAFARKILTKVGMINSVLDDIYDVYGILGELELLTNAIERWDINVASELPEYMKTFYKAFLDIYDEIEEQMAMKEASYVFPYAREAMKTQARAFMEETRWLQRNKLPTMEEYMRVALVSSGHSLLAIIALLEITALLGMGSIATEDIFEWMSGNPKLLKASLIIFRLSNDVVSHEFEQKRGHVASAVECYMHEYGVSEEVALEELRKQIKDAWEDLNEECMKPINVPKPILMVIVNFTRVIDFIYKDGDGYTNGPILLKNPIASLLVDSVLI